MRAGVHVRIHPHCDRRDPLEPSGHAIDAVQLRFAFDVESINAAAQREFNFLFGLAHAGKRAFPRRSAGGNHAAQFALADDVEAATQVGESAQDSEVGVRLDRVADEVLERRQRGVELAKVVRQGALRIDVKRRAELLDERINRNALAVELARQVMKIVHRRQLCQGSIHCSTPKGAGA